MRLMKIHVDLRRQRRMLKPNKYQAKSRLINLVQISLMKTREDQERARKTNDGRCTLRKSKELK